MSALPPVYTSASRILILGSMPGRLSLQKNQYYAHPSNLFWSIVLHGVAASSELPYTKKIAAVVKAKIALWDVLAECQRKGSLDSNIVRGSEVFNPLDDFVARLPQLRAVLFNGQKARALFDQRFKSLRTSTSLNFVVLPSTSPAHAAMDKNQKTQTWRTELVQHSDYFAHANNV